MNIQKQLRAIERKYKYDHETSHIKVDKLLYDLLDLDDKSKMIISKLCPWYS